MPLQVTYRRNGVVLVDGTEVGRVVTPEEASKGKGWAGVPQYTFKANDGGFGYAPRRSLIDRLAVAAYLRQQTRVQTD